MYVYCNFYCSPAKKNGSTPHFFWAGDATDIWRICNYIVCLTDMKQMYLNKYNRGYGVIGIPIKHFFLNIFQDCIYNLLATGPLHNR